MKITWNELTVNFSEFSQSDLLKEWRWIVDDSFSPILVSSLGDIFLENLDRTVHWLDVGTAKLIKVATSSTEFKQLIQKPENADLWFSPQLIGDLITTGIILELNQCYSYKVPPTLNGSYEISNFEPTDLSVHFATLGSIQNKIKELPEGTSIKKFTYEK